MTTVSDLLARMGFAAAENGTFSAAGRVELEPLGKLFFKVRINLDNGNSISAVFHARALKMNNSTAKEKPTTGVAAG